MRFVDDFDDTFGPCENVTLSRRERWRQGAGKAVLAAIERLRGESKVHKGGPKKKVNHKVLVTFHQVFWALFWIVTVLALMERFLLNYRPEGQLADEKFSHHFLSCWRSESECQPWLLLFHIVMRITARVQLVALPAFFVTMTRISHNWLIEATSGSCWVDFSDAASSSYRAHMLLGKYIFTSVVALHVGGALLPLFDLKFRMSEEKPQYFYLSNFRQTQFNAVSGYFTYRFDDFYQGAIGLFISLGLQPLTILWRRARHSYYNVSQFLHIVGAIAILWLVYRIPEHIRSFAFVTPFVIWWFLDRVCHAAVYRHKVILNMSMSLFHVPLDDNYAVVFFDAKEVAPYSSQIGDLYYYSSSSTHLSFQHPYTHFCYSRTELSSLVWSDYTKQQGIMNPLHNFNNHNVMDLEQVGNGGQSPADFRRRNSVRVTREEDGTKTVELVSLTEAKRIETCFRRVPEIAGDALGTIVALHKENHSDGKRCSRRRAFNQLMCDRSRLGEARAARENLHVVGPYRRIYRRLQRQPQPNPYIIVCTGTGISVALDYIFWVRQDPDVRMTRPVQLVVSTHSLSLLAFSSDIIMKHADMAMLSATIHLTSREFELTGHSVTAGDEEMADVTHAAGRVTPKAAAAVMVARSSPNTPVTAANSRAGSPPPERKQWTTATRRGFNSGDFNAWVSPKLDDGDSESDYSCDEYGGRDEKCGDGSLSIGKFDLDTLLANSPVGSEVYYCGSTAIQQIIERKCRRNKRRFYAEVPFS